MKMRTGWIVSGLAALIAWGVLVHAEEQSSQDTSAPAEQTDTTAPERESTGEAGGQETTDSAEEGRQASAPTARVRSREFRPSERITVDNSVPYPVDI